MAIRWQILPCSRTRVGTSQSLCRPAASTNAGATRPATMGAQLKGQSRRGQPMWSSTLNARRLGRLVLKAGAGVTLAYILTPLLFVTWLAFFQQEIPAFPPEGYSLRWFLAIAGNDRFVAGFLLSLELAVIATAIGLLIGLPAALILARTEFTGHEAIMSLLLLPLIVPGLVLGIALYVFTVHAEIATGLPLLGSLAGLIAGHVLIVIPWTVRLVSASLSGLDRTIEEAAQSLGANRWVT